MNWVPAKLLMKVKIIKNAFNASYKAVATQDRVKKIIILLQVSPLVFGLEMETITP